jgi:hypothetical protein
MIGCCVGYNARKPVLFQTMGSPLMPTAVTVLLTDAELAALDRYIAVHRPGHSRAEVMAEIAARWAETQQPASHPAPDEGLRPDELNASNDS